MPLVLTRRTNKIMLRFIIKHKSKDSASGAEYETHSTLDQEVPELERLLRSGGYGEQGYLVNSVQGIEIRQTIADTAATPADTTQTDEPVEQG